MQRVDVAQVVFKQREQGRHFTYNYLCMRLRSQYGFSLFWIFTTQIRNAIVDFLVQKRKVQAIGHLLVALLSLLVCDIFSCPRLCKQYFINFVNKYLRLQDYFEMDFAFCLKQNLTSADFPESKQGCQPNPFFFIIL